MGKLSLGLFKPLVHFERFRWRNLMCLLPLGQDLESKNSASTGSENLGTSFPIRKEFSVKEFKVDEGEDVHLTNS